MDCKLAVITCPGQGPRPAAAAIDYYRSTINKSTWVINKETHETFDLKIIIHKYITMLWIEQMECNKSILLIHTGLVYFYIYKLADRPALWAWYEINDARQIQTFLVLIAFLL